VRNPNLVAALMGVLAVAPFAAQASAPPARSAALGQNSQQKLDQAEDHLDRMRLLVKQVAGRLEDARKEKDIVKLNCVNEKLAQIKGLLKVSEQAKVAAQQAVARRDESAEGDFQKVGVAREKADKLRSEAEECVGQLAFAVDQKTIVEVEQPTDLPDQDKVTGEPPPPILSRPPPASLFY
jgi:TolA-binding protein